MSSHTISPTLIEASRSSIPSDSPAAVAQVVAAILDGPPLEEERGVPRALQEITRIRSAARRILEAHLEPASEDQLLGVLARMAARAELSEWAIDAVVTEIRGPGVEQLDHSLTLAHERLRRAQYESCPVCLGRVLSEVELENRRRRERWTAEALDRWEGAAR